MKNRKGQPQKRGIRYEKQKAKEHKAIHVGGPGKEDARKGRQKFEIKDRENPVTRPELITMKRKGVTKIISKAGFTRPALEYGKGEKLKLYERKRKIV